ncbi:LOW QUALITY PROTEIN: leukocyte immunoglobulin-like receptor subfamily A member 5 [Suncus etruscus]|uniref:LOW QUALITY PROTEIN: leukocyte immunoglobulin-like receptor subfamily A member 5 n=1 Tax=Suncus etruscus TaxID=109475 RepID=UPI002110A4FB|nr:LOW QUALITY PROTEIN: leukocyte immunoglobulin-like receptor subfamily A member 5 [Suncus etruscus]
MTPFMTLLCLGVLPRPILWAKPGSVVPQWSPVTLWCKGSPGTQEFHLHKKGSSSPWFKQPPQAPGNQAKVSFPYITEVHAGTYYCYYFSNAGWSVDSNSLELGVSGLYRKPSLSALPSSVVASGGTVTLQCGSEQEFDRFILTQEGDTEIPRILESQPPTGHLQALFLVGPVTPEHRWTFRCYGHFSRTPNQWSEPSDLLQLLVSASYPRAYTMENFIRLGVAGFILLILEILLLEAWYSRRKLAKDSTSGPAESEEITNCNQLPQTGPKVNQ